MKFAASGLALLLAALSIPVVQAQAPPAAPLHPVSETYFGTTVADPYRWMENGDDPAVKAWFKGQADYTNSVLSRLPGRAALLARITALDNADTTVENVQTAGGRYFYRKAAPGDVNSKLYVRDGLNGSERMLLDPQALTAGGVHYSIDYFAPSPDGKLVAVGVSPGGSEASTMRLLKTSDGSETGERIDRTDYPAVSWVDGRSFFYSRLQKLGPNDPPTGKYQKGIAFRHVVGDSPDKDTPVFGYGLSSQVSLALDDVPEIVSIPGSSYVFGVIARGVQNENAVFYAPRKSVKGAATPWKRLAGFADDVVAIDDDDGSPTGLAARGDDVYLLTHKDAPRYKIIQTSLKNPDLSPRRHGCPGLRSGHPGDGAGQRRPVRAGLGRWAGARSARPVGRQPGERCPPVSGQRSPADGPPPGRRSGGLEVLDTASGLLPLRFLPQCAD